jgi:DNA-binding transcriptional regulator YiaG
MTDIELTEKINNIEWKVDFDTRTVKSDIAVYKIVKGDGYVDLKSYWISSALNPPPAMSVVFEINRSATAAYNAAVADKKKKLIPSKSKIIELKSQYNLTNERIGLLCGVASRTVRAWLSEFSNMPVPCWRLLRIMVGEITVEEAMEEAEI